MTLDRYSVEENYLSLFTLEVGDVVKVLDFETVMERIEEFKPEGLIFELTPITPGTKLFTIYGCDHCIVTEKQAINNDTEETTTGTEETNSASEPANTENEETSDNTEVSEETT